MLALPCRPTPRRFPGEAQQQSVRHRSARQAQALAAHIPRPPARKPTPGAKLSTAFQDPPASDELPRNCPGEDTLACRLREPAPTFK